MKLWIKLVAVSTLAVPLVATAADAPKSATPAVLKALFDCRAITTDAERLACYDAAVGQVNKAEKTGEVIIVDEQLTPFVEGVHTSNRSQQNDRIALPGVGERLEPGDEVGLVFVEADVQYAAVLSAQSVPNLLNVVNFAFGTSIPAIGSALDGSLLAAPNPHDVTVEGVGLPILKAGTYAGSRLLQ